MLGDAAGLAACSLACLISRCLFPYGSAGQGMVYTCVAPKLCAPSPGYCMKPGPSIADALQCCIGPSLFPSSSLCSCPKLLLNIDGHQTTSADVYLDPTYYMFAGCVCEKVRIFHRSSRRGRTAAIASALSGFSNTAASWDSLHTAPARHAPCTLFARHLGFGGLRVN